MATGERTLFHPAGWPPAPGYSHAVLTHGPLVFVSGQVALDTTGKIVSFDFESQVVQVFENLRVVLETAGTSFAKLVKLSTFVVDLDGVKLQTLRRVRSRYLAESHPPASTLLGVHRLFHPDILVEIEAIAEVG